MLISFAVAASGGGSSPGPTSTVTSLVPQPNQLPGTSVLQNIADGLDSWALIAAGVGVVVGAVIWAFGHYSQNWQQAYNGRKGVIVSALAALLIGGASHIIGFFLNKGSTL